MFGVSLGELAIIALVALIMMKPEDAPELIKRYRQIVGKIKNSKKEITNLIADIESESEVNSYISHIKGDDGNLYENFDLEKIKQELQAEAKEKCKNTIE